MHADKYFVFNPCISVSIRGQLYSAPFFRILLNTGHRSDPMAYVILRILGKSLPWQR